MALTATRLKVMIDTELSATKHAYIGFSTNGTSITATIAKVLVPGGWTTPTAADPYTPSNTNASYSGTASSDVTITHWVTCSASGVAGTEYIDVTGTDPVVTSGGRLSIAANALKPCTGTTTHTAG